MSKQQPGQTYELARTKGRCTRHGCDLFGTYTSVKRKGYLMWSSTYEAVKIYRAIK